jgi:hypothetical protein
MPRFKKMGLLKALSKNEIDSEKSLRLETIIGAQGRSRTGTGFNSRGILSPLRLPVSPPGQIIWRLRPESNRRPRLCRPLHNHSATQPKLNSSVLSLIKNSIFNASLFKYCLERNQGLLFAQAKAPLLSNSKKKSDHGVALIWSGKRDSNSRPQPWQGCALPTELFPPLYGLPFYRKFKHCQQQIK